MDITNWKDTEEFKKRHDKCRIHTSLTDDGKDTITMFCEAHNEMILTRVPYRMFCLHLEKCAGRGSCPRNYSCCE